MDYYDPADGRSYSNYIMRWTHGGRHWEKKRQVTDASQSSHGVIEPIAYLHTFKLMQMTGELTGIRDVPPAGMIAAYVAEHEGQLQALYHSMQ